MALLPIAVVFVGFSVTIAVGLFSTESFSSLVITLLFGLFFLGVSFLLLYFALVLIFNRAIIEISQGRLVVEHAPIPYARRRVLDPAVIRQIYVIRRESRYAFSYKVYALIRGCAHRHLLTVDNGVLALYLEQEIERALGMEDQVVRGEWRPEPYLWEA
jgi:hypothetical protein